MASSSEIDQMIKNRQSDSHEFAEALLHRYSGYIQRLSTSILRDPEEAQDVVQETFIEALVYIDRYEPGTNLKAWLSRIAVNKCLGLLRRRKMKDVLERAISDIQNIHQNSVFETVMQAEKKSEVWSAVNTLNDKHRIPVLLYYMFDLKIREIATILDVPVGTVSSRLHYALRKLDARLQDIAEG